MSMNFFALGFSLSASSEEHIDIHSYSLSHCFVSSLTEIGYFVLFKDFQGMICFTQCGRIYCTLPSFYVTNKAETYSNHAQHYKINRSAYQNATLY